MVKIKKSRAYVAMTGRLVLPFTARSTQREVRDYLRDYMPQVVVGPLHDYRIVPCDIVIREPKPTKPRK